MAEVKPMETKDTEDMTPVPTQAEIDKLKSGGVEPKKATKAAAPPEELPPTPTQKENDAYKSKVYGVSDETRPEEDVPAGRQAPPEELPPTPTQFENDLFKTAAMSGGKLPEGGGDPQKIAEAKKKKELEANKPGTYQTRATTATPKAE